MEPVTHSAQQLAHRHRGRYPQSRFLVIAKNVLAVSDVLALYLAFVLSVFLIGIFYQDRSAFGYDFLQHVYRFSKIGFLWIFGAAIFQLYSTRSVSYIENLYRTTWRTKALYVVLFSVFFAIGSGFRESLPLLLVFFTLYGLYLVGNRFLFTYLQQKFSRQFQVQKPVAVIGNTRTAARLHQYFASNNSHYDVPESYIWSDTFVDEQGTLHVPTWADRFRELAEDHDVDEVYVSLPENLVQQSALLLDTAEKYCLRVNFVPNIDSYGNLAYQTDYIGNIPILTVGDTRLTEMKSRVKKRFVDLLFSTLVIVLVMSWLVPLLAILIRLESRGPVFFVQQRSGRNNKPFRCYKFRSMRVNDESDTRQTGPNDDRTTRIGRFMRHTNIDEFPQFFNVFKGEMSVVGPRPHMLTHTEYYGAFIEKYMARHYAKPGITGWAQVNGYRGETQDPMLMQKRVEHDIWYLSNWSAMLDVRIVVMTVINMLRKEKNAY